LNWDNKQNEWVNLYFGKYQYNNEKLVSELWKKWQDDTFKVCCKTSYSYNEDGKLIHQLDQTLNAEGEWRDDLELTYEFNDAGSILLQEKKYNGKKKYKLQYEYNSNNEKIELIYQIGDDNNEWKNSLKVNILYSLGNRVVISLNWDDDSSNWVNEYKEVYLYSDENNLTEYQRFYWDKDENSWKFAYKTIYFWSQFGFNAIENICIENAFVYPNPASDYIYVVDERNDEIDKIEIFSEAGRLLKTFTSHLYEHLDISELRRGMYYMKVKATNKYKILKFVVGNTK